MSLELKRPLAFFDLETTGTDPSRDKIVEIAVIRVDPGGEREATTHRINPERPIPPEATAVHGIADSDVASAPRFLEVARPLLDTLKDADLAGFNVRRFIRRNNEEDLWRSFGRTQGFTHLQDAGELTGFGHIDRRRDVDSRP